MRTLYISYFGLREPLVQTQVLPYLRQLRQDGIEITLLTFEPNRRRSWPQEKVDESRERLGVDGIRWISLAYHKRPSLPATVYDILAGAWVATRLVRKERIEIIHARAHVAAAIGSLTRSVTGARLIFDIRGFNAEEYVEAGTWSAGGLKYRLMKRAEKAVLAAADGFVVLTERARNILFPGCLDEDSSGRPIEVIPCCVDAERFQAAEHISQKEAKRDLGLEGRRVLVYVGALGGLYPTEEIAQFLAAAHEHDRTTFSMVLTQSPPDVLARRLGDLGVASADCLVRKVPVAEIPRYLKAADVALSMKRPGYSQASCSPTKIAEYLASGLPVISSAGIGDTDEILEQDQVGVVFREFNRRAYTQALQEAEALLLTDDVRERCRASAGTRFNLEEVGGRRYRRLYHRLFNRASRSHNASLL